MTDEKKPSVQWLKGRLREEHTACECVWQHVELFVKLAEGELKSALEIPGMERAPFQLVGTGRAALSERFLAEMPELGLVCHSPKLRAALGAIPLGGTGELLPLSAIGKLRVSLAICRMCPFFESSQ